MNVLEGESACDDAGHDRHDTIASAFERQVAATPDNLAVVTEERKVTYRELNATAEKIAAGLDSMRAAPDRPVALMMREGANLIAAMLGAAKAGRIFVPLDMTYPNTWLSRVLDESGAAHILTDKGSLATAEESARGELPVFQVEDLTQSLAGSQERARISPDSAALIVYTSGSTGKPKGVIQSHRTALLASKVRGRMLRLRPDDRIGNLKSSAVTSGLNTTFLPLLWGASVFPFDIRSCGLQALADWLDAQNITGIAFSGSLLRTWLGSLPEGRRFRSLRFIVAGAEPLYEADVESASRHLVDDWNILHGLASTETGMATVGLLSPQSFSSSGRRGAGAVPIGKPVPGTQIEIRDEEDRIAATGQTGEIVIKSRSVALGYWNDPAMTAAVFSVDPEDATVRIYRSGDLGRWRSDGKLEHLGRKGRKIKLRGYSVEPAEVERSLMDVEGVRDAAVTVSSDRSGEAHLIGYVIGSGRIQGETIRDELRKRLPAHLVPTAIVVLDEFPLTAHGKVDRNALPSPDWAGANRKAYRAPSNAEEHGLVSIWQDILKIPKIGVDDDFYDLGGSSLQAFTIFARVMGAFGRDLPPTTMAKASTIAKLAEVLRASALVQVPHLVPFRATGTKAPLFIVHARFGDIMFAREIALHLKSDRPVYGLQPARLDGSHRIPSKFEAIAAEYLADIRALQKTGPYHLAGYSWGGRLALEMAQQLRREGESVAFLGLIDTMYDPKHDVPQEKPLARLKRHVTALPGQSMTAYIAKRIRKTTIHHAASAWKSTRQIPNKMRIRLGWPIPYDRRRDVYELVYGGAARRYTIKTYQGPIVMFASLGKEEFQRSQWSRIAQDGLSVHAIPAGHQEMVWPPYSAILAAQLDRCLDDIGS